MLSLLQNEGTIEKLSIQESIIISSVILSSGYMITSNMRSFCNMMVENARFQLLNDVGSFYAISYLSAIGFLTMTTCKSIDIWKEAIKSLHTL